MVKIILDTSVIIKWFIEEEDSDKARKLLDEIKNGAAKLILPRVFLLELINGLYWGNRYPIEGILKALAAIDNLQPEFVELEPQLIVGVVEQVVKLRIAAYDALFLALAQKRQIPLITADRKHHLQKYSPLVKYLDQFFPKG